MKIYLKALYVTIVHLWIMNPIMGQGVESPQTPEAEPKRTFCVSTFGSPELPELFIKEPQLKDPTPLQSGDFCLSKDFAYETNTGIQLLERVVNPETKQTSYKEYLIVSVPARIEKPLVLLFRPSNGKLTYQVMEMAAQNYPASSFRIFNLTSQTLAFKINEKFYEVKAGQISLLPMRTDKRSTIGIEAGMVKAGKFVSSYSRKMLHHPDKRATLFFFAHTDEKGEITLESKSLSDYITP